MSSEEESSLDIEIEALKAIYIHELEVVRDESQQSTCVKVSLHPATADNAEEQYVRLDLVLVIPPEYPDVLPEITIRNPRGLSDDKIAKIQEDLQDTAQENVGSPMLYQLIEVAKEHLTEENVPCCQCTICLYGFAEGDVFTKTECYHYFHSHCLARYVRHALEQIALEKAHKMSPTPPSANADDHAASTKVVCPVCRLPLPPLLGLTEEEHPPPMEQQHQPAFCMTPELEQLQQSMAQLYVHQQRQGGIINVDAEKNKFLLEISAAPENSTAPEAPKPSFGAFKLRNWRPPTRHMESGMSDKGNDAPLHKSTDRQQTQHQHEPRFSKPPRNRPSRPTNRQHVLNDGYDEPIANGFVEHSGETSSSSGAERLHRSETGQQRSRRSRPHRGRGRGGGQRQQQNWSRPPPERKEADDDVRSPEAYRQDYDGSRESSVGEENNTIREAITTTMHATTDLSPSWNSHFDRDYGDDGYVDIPPGSPADGCRYGGAPESQSRQHRGGQGHRRGRRGGGSGNGHHSSAQQAFRKKQLKSQSIAPRNHEPPGISTPVENR